MPETKIGEGEEINLKDLFLKLSSLKNYFLRKWYFVFIGALAGTLIGVFYAYLKIPKYTASTTFVLEDSKTSNGGQYGGVASLIGIDLQNGSGIFEGENIIELYKSRRMIQTALLSPEDSGERSKLLVDRYILINKIRKNWEGSESLRSLVFSSNVKNLTRVQDSVLSNFVEDIRNNYLTVEKPDKKLSIIEVTVKSKDEFFASAFDRKIVETVNNFYIQTKVKKALQNLAILQHQADSVRNAFGNSVYSSAAVIDQTPNLNPTRQTLRVSGQKYQFSADASKTILAQLTQNLESAKISLRNETPLIQTIDNPIMPLPIDKANKIKLGLIGFLAGTFLSMLYLVVTKIYANIMAD